MARATVRRMIPALGVSSLLLCLAVGAVRPQEPPSQPPAGAEREQPEGRVPLTVARVVELLRAGTSHSTLIQMVEGSSALFDLTVEDAIRLRKLGAPPELIRLLARGGTPAAPEAAPVEPAEAPPQPAPDALTVRKVQRMHRKGIPADEIARMVASRGLKEPLDLDQLVECRSQGVPEVVILAMAGGGAPDAAAASAEGTVPGPQAVAAAAPRKKEKPLKTADIRKMIESSQEPAAIVAVIEARGIREPLTLDEALELRRLGATDLILAAINEAAAFGAKGEEREGQEPAGTETSPPPSPEAAVPPAENADTLTVYSVPAGADVYVTPARTRIEESLQHGYLAGRTPLALSLAPGDYSVIVQKEAGDFEAGLVPAWRTMHDRPGTRSILDNADLTFDPASCCLPGSLTGTVDLHPVPEDQSRVIIGDQFDGLPPYLFDGETLQIMRVRKLFITHAMKLYHVRKTAGQPRLLVVSFVPAEGDPLDGTAIAGLPAGSPFDPLVAAPELDYLSSASGQAALAAALGFETDHLGAGVAMLRRAGKAILHQQFDGETRLLTLAVDYGGRLRVTDLTIRPVDPFAPPPAPKGKKKKTAAPLPPAPLPGIERTVVPGLGAPRLVLDNATKKGLALLFSDGQFCFVPPSTTREFVIDPGTFDLQVMSAGTIGPAPEGRVHLSYHARYTMTFR